MAAMLRVRAQGSISFAKEVGTVYILRFIPVRKGVTNANLICLKLFMDLIPTMIGIRNACRWANNNNDLKVK